jgi:hypothetical protein
MVICGILNVFLYRPVSSCSLRARRTLLPRILDILKHLRDSQRHSGPSGGSPWGLAGKQFIKIMRSRAPRPATALARAHSAA